MKRGPVLLAGLVFLTAVVSVSGQEARSAASKSPALYQQTVSRGITFLRKAQNRDGSFSSELSPAITALVTTALLKHGVPTADPLVADGLRYLEGFVQPDGGIYDGPLYQNYETCLAILCFAETKDERYREVLDRAEAFVRQIQWDETEGSSPASPAFGGAGYGNHKRPDLSNTSFLMEVLHRVGTDPNDPAIQNALAFVSRCQNLESHHNTMPFSTKNPDGGFYYTAAAGGGSQAGGSAEEGFRSYGSMTYAGLKSMIYAGLTADDPRVEAAVEWIRGNYDLKRNPGMPPQMRQAGLFYYYHTFAKTLHALGKERFVDGEGNEHDWRAELLDELASRQSPAGSWVNDNPRWLEGDGSLVSAYALLALAYCRPGELNRLD